MRKERIITADDDALGFSISHHGVVGGVGHGENMRRQLAQPSILIQFDVFRIVNGVKFEGIDGDEDRADVGVDVTGLETGPKVVHQSFFIQIGQLAQVGVFTIPRLVQEAVKVVSDHLRVSVERFRPDRVVEFLAQIKSIFRLLRVIHCRSLGSFDRLMSFIRPVTKKFMKMLNDLWCAN